MAKSFVGFLFFLFVTACSAQLGTQINSPAYNSTIKPGDKIDIQFGYQNMGSGIYTVDIDVWTDNTLRTLAKNVVENYSVPPGNSTGTQLAFYKNASYTWSVPHGFNETIWLTVTTKPNLTYNAANYSMRSRAIKLNVNAGAINMPTHYWALLALSFTVLYFMNGF